MSTWTTSAVAQLKVKNADSTGDSFTFDGVATDASAGTPEDYLGAVNNILDIVGMEAVKDGMTRTIKQGVSD